MLLLTAGCARRRPAQPVVPFDAIWKYLTTNATIDASPVGYDDSAWSQGPFPFGDGIYPEPLQYGLNNVPNTNVPSLTALWFRKHFRLSSTPSRDAVAKVFQYNYLDFYMNGTLVYSNRSNGTAFSVFFHTITIPAALMVPGDNVIAIYGNGYSPSVGQKTYVNCSVTL